LKFKKGQSLIELLVAISVGTILIGGSAGLMGVSLKSYGTVRKHLQANVLIRQSAEVIQSLARSDWHSIDELEKGSDYQITASSTTWTISTEQETDTINDIPYKRYFQVYDVLRDNTSGDISISTSGTNVDLSTKKITVFLGYGDNYVSSSSVSFYLTRSEDNKVFHQFDWSGGSGVGGPTPNPNDKYATSTNVAISTAEQITMVTTTSDGWLESSILDTGVSGGAGFNSLLWLGDLGTGGAVKFQIAFSTTSTSDTWTYYGCTTDPSLCLDSDYWTTATTSLWSLSPSSSLPFLYSDTAASPQNKRYIRYKVNLSTSSTTPQVDDIIINWSP